MLPHLRLYAEQIARKYDELNPAEAESREQHLRNNPRVSRDHVWQDLCNTFENWLQRVIDKPETAIATTNWCGKVTQAYLAVRGLKAKRKSMMLELVKGDLMLAPTHGLLIEEGSAREESVGDWTVRGTNWFAVVCVNGVRTVEEFSNTTCTNLSEQPSAFERALAWAKANQR